MDQIKRTNYHLKSRHSIAVKFLLIKASAEDESKLEIEKIDSFFKSKKQSFGQLLSQLIATDGLTFNQIDTSERLP